MNVYMNRFIVLIGGETSIDEPSDKGKSNVIEIKNNDDSSVDSNES